MNTEGRAGPWLLGACLATCSLQLITAASLPLDRYLLVRASLDYRWLLQGHK